MSEDSTQDEEKGFGIILIIFILLGIIVGIAKNGCASTEQKEYNQYKETLSSYMDELSSAPANKSASTKRKINDLIRKYKTWKGHAGVSDSEAMDDMIKDYRSVNTANERTIYMGGN